MINSKERSRLLALSNKINATVFIGKGGLTESVLAQINEMLIDHELIKIGVQKNADYTSKELIVLVCEKLNAEPVHAIGSKIIIYRYSDKEGIEHIDYKNQITNKTVVEEKKEPKKKILGRKTLDSKPTSVGLAKKQSYNSIKDNNLSHNGNGNKSYSNENKRFTKTRNSSDSYAPYKKDGVTIYKKKIGKPTNSKKNNKK